MARVSVGDVFELRTACGLAYVQYTAKHRDYGHLIRVLNEVCANRPTDLGRLVEQPERFVVFFPVSVAASRNILKKVGNFPIPSKSRGIPRMRREGMTSRDGKVTTWFIMDGQEERSVTHLSDADAKLPIEEIWNDTLLAERICSGWRPEDDR